MANQRPTRQVKAAQNGNAVDLALFTVFTCVCATVAAVAFTQSYPLLGVMFLGFGSVGVSASGVLIGQIRSA